MKFRYNGLTAKEALCCNGGSFGGLRKIFAQREIAVRAIFSTILTASISCSLRGRRSNDWVLAIHDTIDRVRLTLPTFPPESAGIEDRLTAD
jgi:hypothetical protein